MTAWRKTWRGFFQRDSALFTKTFPQLDVQTPASVWCAHTIPRANTTLWNWCSTHELQTRQITCFTGIRRRTPTTKILHHQWLLDNDRSLDTYLLRLRKGWWTRYMPRWQVATCSLRGHPTTCSSYYDTKGKNKTSTTKHQAVHNTQEQSNTPYILINNEWHHINKATLPIFSSMNGTTSTTIPIMATLFRPRSHLLHHRYTS